MSQSRVGIFSVLMVSMQEANWRFFFFFSPFFPFSLTIVAKGGTFEVCKVGGRGPSMDFR